MPASISAILSGGTSSAARGEVKAALRLAGRGTWQVRTLCGRRTPFHPLDGAGEGEQRPLAGFQNAAQKDHRAAGPGDFAGADHQLTLLRSIEELAAE